MSGRRPNILLITTDTQRCDTLRCMGNPNAVSPNLDKLAGEGVLFMQAHTPSPVCSPARCTLLTGLHTPIHGCIENGIKRREDVPVFTDYLKEQGYKNIMVGKAHFDPIPDSFEVKHIIKGEKGGNGDDCYAEFIKQHGYSRASSHPNNVPEELCMDAYLVDTAIQEMEKAREEGDRPFFTFCSLLSPHSPHDPPGKWADLYDNIPLPEINYIEGEVKNHPLHLKRLVGTMEDDEASDRNGKKALKQNKNNKAVPSETEMLGEDHGTLFNEKIKESADRMRKLYYGLAAYCDAQIGRLIKFLDDSGLRKDTLVIFTSDHGQQFFDHGFNNKHNFYDSSWRIPLILSMPGTIPEGEKREFAVWNDITATILAAAGTSCAAVQGFDLFSPLTKGEASPRKCAVGTLYKSAALATKRWKLEYYFEEGKGRLFDRNNDPREQNDLYDDPGHLYVRNELVRILLTWRSDICDVNYLIKNTSGGGPVARRISSHTKAMKGIDSEERLNNAAEILDIQS